MGRKRGLERLWCGRLMAIGVKNGDLGLIRAAMAICRPYGDQRPALRAGAFFCAFGRPGRRLAGAAGAACVAGGVPAVTFFHHLITWSCASSSEAKSVLSQIVTPKNP